jgi:hypothetical protein
MSVGLDALQTVMLALAVGCGAPALIYLAFKGTLRNEKKAEPKEIEFEPLPDLPTSTPRESQQQQLEPGSHVYASVIGFARIEDSPPLPARITIYVPVKYAEQIAEKLGWIKPQPKPSQAEQKPKADEKPPAKPIVRRIGVEYGKEEEKRG